MNFRLPDLTATGGAIRRARSRLRAFDEARTERQYLACRCAKTDMRFEAVFVRQRGTPRYALETVRPSAPQGNQGPADAVSTTRHDIRHFDLNAVDCPHCGERRFTKCGRCGAFVCDGRSERRRGGFYFRCAPSCGSEGPIGTLERIETTSPPPVPQIAQGKTPLRLPKPKP
jgi:DNA-directed RNA polymerase subunit RPC12/RpoP